MLLNDFLGSSTQKRSSFNPSVILKAYRHGLKSYSFTSRYVIVKGEELL